MTNISQEELDIALLQSSLSGHATACKVLLQIGANPNVKQPSEGIGPGGMGNYHGGGNSPLHHAACNGHTDICSMLLEYGADINIRNSSGLTPLFVGVYKNHRTTGLYLVSRGADTIYFGAPAQAHDQTNNSRHLHVNATEFKGMSMHTAAIRLGDINRLTELLSQPGDEDKAELLKGLVKEAKSAKRPDIVAFLQAKGASAQISSVRKQASQQP